MPKYRVWGDARVYIHITEVEADSLEEAFYLALTYADLRDHDLEGEEVKE